MPSGGTQQAAGGWYQGGATPTVECVTGPVGVKESMHGEKREWAEAGKCLPLRGQSRLREVGGDPRAMRTELTGGKVSVMVPELEQNKDPRRLILLPALSFWKVNPGHQ